MKFKLWSARSWLVHHITLTEFKKVFPRCVTGRVIDVGCGIKPYEHFIRRHARSYFGLDRPGTLHGAQNTDVFGSALCLPFKTACCDTVFAGVVIEHVEEPLVFVNELHRIVRPGGFAICTAPFMWHIHEDPRDFYRFTSYGLEYLFTKAGFALEMIKPMSGFWVTFGQELVYVLWRFHRGPLRFIPVIPALGAVIQAVSLIIDKIDRSPRWTWAYLVVARKA